MNWYKKMVLAGSLPAWNTKKLIKRLQEVCNLTFIRHGKGDDQVWGIPGTNKQTLIPFGQKSINPQTLMNICRHLDISIANFKKKQHKQKPVDPIQEPVQEPVQEQTPDWQKANWYQDQLSYA